MLLLGEPKQSWPRPVGPPQHPPLAPSSAHDTQAHSPLSFRVSRSPPSAAPACQRAAPREVTTSARLLRHRRFTRSIRPPVPRSGVAPHRSPQSLPVSRHPVKARGQGHCVLPFPRRGRIGAAIPFSSGDAPCCAQQLWELHQCTTAPLLCQVGCRGPLFAPDSLDGDGAA